jgi:hypothetical protein
MNDIKVLVIGSITEAIIKSVFDVRIAQESRDSSLNAINRAMKIKEMKSQILGFVKRNPNSNFELVVPELKSNKNLTLVFSNFQSSEPEEECDSKYKIVINDDFVTAKVIQKVTVGEDIILRIKSS